MSLSRRRFLEIGGVVAASSAIPASAGAAVGAAVVPSISGNPLLHSLPFQEARKLVGCDFSVDTGLGQALQMQLISVDELPVSKNERVAGEAFMLRFHLRRGTRPSQGTYTFDHHKLGKCPLFVAPMGGRKDEYAAVINHRKPA